MGWKIRVCVFRGRSFRLVCKNKRTQKSTRIKTCVEKKYKCLMYRLICQKPVHFLSAQMAFVSTFFQMFIVLGMYYFVCYMTFYIMYSVRHGHLHTGELTRHFVFWQVTSLGVDTWDPNYTPGVDLLDHDFL